MFDARIQPPFRRLWLARRRRARPALLDAPRRLLPGLGTELIERRDYTLGDDYRYVDWRLCARRDELLSRVFAGRAACSLHVLVDCSSSMAASLATKFDIACYAAALLGYISIQEGDAVSLAGFAARLTTVDRPLFGSACTGRWLRGCRSLAMTPGVGDLVAAVEGLLRCRRRPGPVIVASDFYFRGGFQAGLARLLGAGYLPRLVQVVDPREADPPPTGDREIHDVESGAVGIATVTESMRRRYRERYGRFQQSLAGWARSHDCPMAALNTDMTADEVAHILLRGAPGRTHAHVG